MLFKNNKDAGLIWKDCVDEEIQKQAKKAAAKIGGEELVMDLGDGSKVVNVVDLKKVKEAEAKFGDFISVPHRYEWYDYEYREDYVSYSCPGIDKNGKIQLYDAAWHAFQCYAVKDKHGDYSAIMLIRDGSLQEFRVKEASEENLSHVRKVAEHLNKANQNVLCQLFIDDKGNCSAPKGFVIKNVPDLYGCFGSGVSRFLGEFPVKDGFFPDLSDVIVEGSLDVSFHDLKSLKGIPKEITENFKCSSNRLQSLKDGPQKVGGEYDCIFNQINNFDDLDCDIGGDFVFDHDWYHEWYDPDTQTVEHCSGRAPERISHCMSMREEPWKLELARKIYGKSHNRG